MKKDKNSPPNVNAGKGNSGGTGPQIASSVFDDLEALKLSPEDITTVGSREVLNRVPIRRPNPQEYFRVHPGLDMQLTTGVFTDSAERETYFVAPGLRGELAGEWLPRLLVTVLTRQNVLLLWPVPLPDESGRRNAWAESAREACEQAKSHWVRLRSDMSLGAYRIYLAEGKLSEPDWPDKSFKEILALGFRDRVIDSADHPVIRRLRGLS
jgi:hypothetical protein